MRLGRGQLKPSDWNEIRLYRSVPSLMKCTYKIEARDTNQSLEVDSSFYFEAIGLYTELNSISKTEKAMTSLRKNIKQTLLKMVTLYYIEWTEGKKVERSEYKIVLDYFVGSGTAFGRDISFAIEISLTEQCF